MPLTALPTISSITKTDDGSNTNIADSTVYGTSNPDRNEVGVALLAYKVDENLVESALTIQEYDSETATAFVIENTIDGHQKFILLIFDNYDAGTLYTDHDAVFYVTNGLFYRSISESDFSGVDPTNTTNWEEVDPADIYATIDTESESLNVTIGIKQTVLTFTATQCLGDIAPDNAKANCCDGCNDTKLQQKFDDLWLLIFTANIASEREMFTSGEKYMRIADNFCDCNC